MGNSTYYVYILSNKRHTVFYTGITNNLMKRLYEHKNKLAKGFTSKYNIDELLYYEIFYDSITAIHREKQIKKYGRGKKLGIIGEFNPEWKDLYFKICS